MDEQYAVFYRNQYDQDELGLAYLDKNFVVTKDFGVIYKGEDPRTFEHLSQWYVTDNTLNKNAIIKIDFSNAPPKLTTVYGPNLGVKDYPKGKNPTYISHKGELYVVEWFYPLTIYKISNDFSSVEKVYTGTSQKDDKFRGGTPGYATSKEGEYFGFGHYTDKESGVMRHYPFYWKINMNNFSLNTVIINDIPNQSNIMDPVTVIKRDNRILLITAESEKIWFEDQQYKAGIWSIEFPDNLKDTLKLQ